MKPEAPADFSAAIEALRAELLAKLDEIEIKEGEKGDKGDKGDPGPPGLTPFVNEQGNWQIGDRDTGVKATGEPGQDADIEAIVVAVIKAMPAFVFRSVDPETGREYWVRSAKPGDIVDLPGIEVHHVDGASGSLKKVERVSLADVLTIAETPHQALHGD